MAKGILLDQYGSQMRLAGQIQTIKAPLAKPAKLVAARFRGFGSRR
jgi:hypothetical protein